MAIDATREANMDVEENSNNSSKKAEVILQKLEDATDIVHLPPVFSLDSKFLCIASGRNVGVYSVDTGDRLHLLRQHSSDVIGTSVREDGKLLTCDVEGCVALWDISNGKLIKEFSLILPNVSKFLSFYNVGKDKYLVSSRRKNEIGDSQADLWLIGSQNAGSFLHKTVFKNCSSGAQTVAFGCRSNGSLVIAALKSQGVIVKDLKGGPEKMHTTDDRKFTCLSLHPEKMVMATGDTSGRILIWHDFLESNKPVKTVYHWHTLPVASLCFSTEGEFLFSGGSEKVLVKWRLGTAKKQCLPRLGSTIKWIVNAPDNICVATSHSDNAIRFIEPTNKITRAILGLVKHDPIRLEDMNLVEKDSPDVCKPSKRESVMPAGLVWDPRSRGILLNAQSGFLQLFDPHRHSMIFNMDVSNRNVLTDERGQVIGNMEVMRAAVSEDGQWLATLETWAGVSRDIRLKFWRFDSVEANYELNTEVIKPHRWSVTDMAFQPGTSPCLVTLGQDRQFKIWRLIDDTDIYRKKMAWRCEVAGDFRQLMPQALSFSEDGSLLAIAFQDTVTLWDPLTSNLNTTLAHRLVNEPIKNIEFGRDKCFRFLVCATDQSLFAWDVITQGLVWKVSQLPGPIVCLVPDPRSIFMAAVLKNAHVFVFAPSSANPVHHHKPSDDSLEAVAAVFVPRPNPLSARSNPPDWLVHSRLLIADSRQELHQLDDKKSDVHGKSKMTSQPISHMDTLPWTPFAAMKAQQQISAANKISPVVHETGSRGILGYDSVKSLLDTPAPALPPMSRICLSFIKNMMIQHDHPANINGVPVSETEATLIGFQNKPLTRGLDVPTGQKDDDVTLQGLLDLNYQWLCNN